MASTESKLSDVIERVFRVTLNADRAGSCDRLHLESLASEMVMEGAEPPFAVTSDNLERVLFARLSTPADALGSWASDPEAAPFVWLVRSYDRCHQETRKTRSRDEAYAEALNTTLASCFELCVNYSGLLLNPAMAGTFPQPPAAEARGALQLFDAMCANEGLPHGFLSDFAAKFAEDGLADVLGPCIAQLPSLIRRISPLGDYHKPVSLLCALAASKPAAAVLVAHPRWLPPRRSARPPLGGPAPPPTHPTAEPSRTTPSSVHSSRAVRSRTPTRRLSRTFERSVSEGWIDVARASSNRRTRPFAFASGPFATGCTRPCTPCCDTAVTFERVWFGGSRDSATRTPGGVRCRSTR